MRPMIFEDVRAGRVAPRWPLGRAQMPEYARSLAVLREALETAVILDATSTSRAMFESDDRTDFDYLRDFANPVAPWPVMWFESHAPRFLTLGRTREDWNAKPRRSAWGFGVFTIDRERPPAADDPAGRVVAATLLMMPPADLTPFEAARWLSVAMLFDRLPGAHGAFGPAGTTMYGVTPDGVMVARPGDGGPWTAFLAPVDPTTGPPVEDIREQCDPAFLSLMYALSVANCRNVEATETEPDLSRQQRRAAERKGEPIRRYYVLAIKPGRGGAEARRDSTDKAPRAMHLCRGHFATYSAERPLFGKYSGTFWVPAHIRGSDELGVVAKDYQTTPPPPPAIDAS
jgi:hypothetical protein